MPAAKRGEQRLRQVVRSSLALLVAQFAIVVYLVCRAWQPLAGASGTLSSDSVAFAAARGPGASPPSAEQLLRALGCELWSAADLLLEASAGLDDIVPFFGGQSAAESPRALGTGGTALKSAAEAMLDGDWEGAWGELESASVSFGMYFPEQDFQGLVDLFGYVEPVPQCEWSSASKSLRKLGGCASSAASRVARIEDFAEASVALKAAAEAFERASRLFQPGGFYVPKDPRVTYKGRDEIPPFFVRPALEVAEPVLVPGSYAASLLDEVRAELEKAAAAGGQSSRRAALRRLVRRTHPDQNPGKEEEVLPVLQYVQSLREQDG